MRIRHTYPLQLTVAPNSSGTIDVAVAPPGKKLQLARTVVVFPAGTEGELQIQILYGNMPVIPDSGFITGDDVKLEFNIQVIYDAGTPVRIYYRNLNANYSKTAYIYLEVVEVDEDA